MEKGAFWVEANLFALFFRNLYLESFHLRGIVIVLSWSTMLVFFLFFGFFLAMHGSGTLLFPLFGFAGPSVVGAFDETEELRK